MKRMVLFFVLFVAVVFPGGGAASQPQAKESAADMAISVFAGNESLEEIIVKVVKAYQNKEEGILNDLIAKDFGIALLHRLGMFDIISIYDGIAFDDPALEYVLPYLGIDLEIDYKINFEELPAFSCDEEGRVTWDKPPGIYCDTANIDRTRSTFAKKLDEAGIADWPAEEIKKLEEIEDKSHKVIVLGEGVFVFYVTLLEGKWHLTAIAKFEDCSGI